MEPFSTVLMAGAGIALQGFGMASSYDAAKRQTAAQRQQIEAEKKIEAQKRQAMELSNRRQQVENFRNAQRMRAVALTNATSQGASSGSGLQGGYGQIANQANWNALGMSQNLEIGRNIFGLNSQISDQKISMAEAQRDMQFGNSLTQLGGQLVNSAGAFGKLASGFAPSTPTPQRSTFDPTRIGSLY